MTNVALSHNLSVISGHFEELSDSHAALVPFLAAANRDNAIGNFLLTNDEEVRHFLEFALANLVAEFFVTIINFCADAGELLRGCHKICL